MHRRLIGLFTLGAMLSALPASAQTLSALSVSQETVLGGQMLTGVIALSAPCQSDTMSTVFSLSPAVEVLGPEIRMQTGSWGATFRLQTLPVDAALSTFIGVTVNGTTRLARLTLLPGQPFRTRFLTYRPDTAEWTLRDNADGSTAVVSFGQRGDQPMPLLFHAGSSTKQLAVFRSSTHEWRIRGQDGSVTVIQFGQPGDIPAPSDYLRTGRTQLAVYRPGTRELLIRTDGGETITVPVPFVQPGDHPVSGDYLGLGRGQFAVFRWRTAEWFIRQDDGTPIRIPFGAPGDLPRQGDYLGLGRTQIAVVRPDTGEWFVRTDTGDAIRIPFGSPNDEFMPDFYPPRLGQR